MNHYQRTRKRLRKYYIAKFEAYIRTELIKGVVEIFKEEDQRIHNALMQGEGIPGIQVKGVAGYL